MHEISIVEGVLEIIEKEKKKHNFNKVKLIEIVCGKHNCICEDNLNFCLETVANSTYIEGARFKIRRLPERHRCIECNREFEKQEAAGSICPYCRSENLMQLPNSEMYLSKLEVE